MPESNTRTPPMSLARCKAVLPFLSCKSTSAPERHNISVVVTRSALLRPYWAYISGVAPQLLAKLRGALWLQSASKTSRWPLSVAMATGVFPIQSWADMSAPCPRRISTHGADWAKCKGVIQGTRHELVMNVPEVMSSDLVLHTASLLLTLAPWQQSHFTAAVLSYSTATLSGVTETPWRALLRLAEKLTSISKEFEIWCHGFLFASILDLNTSCF